MKRLVLLVVLGPSIIVGWIYTINARGFMIGKILAMNWNVNKEKK